MPASFEATAEPICEPLELASWRRRWFHKDIELIQTTAACSFVRASPIKFGY